MAFLPQVVRAMHDKGFHIHVTFNDGTTASVDFESWLSGPVFEPLKLHGLTTACSRRRREFNAAAAKAER